MLFFVTLLFESRLLAQNENIEQGLTIQPAIIDVPLIGKSTKTQITIANTSPGAIAIEASIEPFEVKDPLISPIDKNRYDVSTWLYLPKDTWLLARSEEIIVDVEITPPANPTPGGHYGQIAFQIVSGSTTDDVSGAVIRPEVVALIFISVPGNIIENLEIAQSVPKRVIITNRITADLELNNSGNTHLLVRPFLRIGSETNNPKFSQEGEVAIITPGTERSLSLSFITNNLFARYKIWSEVFYGSPTISKITPFTEIIVISPLLVVGVLTGFVVMIAVISNRTLSISHLAFSSKEKKKSHKPGGYKHPLRKSDSKLVKRNK